jgi:hypothetical protein
MQNQINTGNTSRGTTTMKIWYDSGYELHKPYGEQLPTSCWERIYQAPSRTNQDLKVGAECPYCMEGTLVETNEEFTMPESISMKHAKAELKCNKCKAMFWQMDEDNPVERLYKEMGFIRSQLQTLPISNREEILNEKLH